MKNLNNIFKMIVPLLIFGYGLYSFVNNVLFFMKSQVQTVEVLQATKFPGLGRYGHTCWKLTTDFTNLKDGKPVNVIANTGSYFSGQKIKVYYDPSNNQNIKVYDIEYFLDPWVLIIFGVLLALRMRSTRGPGNVKKKNY